jgi:hypothetical protein
MNRRKFGLLAGSSAAALKLSSVPANAQTADPSLLTTTLTPMGAERAGNADGSIPAWTGGYTTIPAGWQPGQWMPDPFASEQPVLKIDASNMADHAANLSDGIMALMTKFGFSINVYPTHRTACAPQEVYDNIAKNVTRAQLNPGGGRLGYVGAFGGAPFPIPNTAVPLDAGAQIMWNHCSRWLGNACFLHSRSVAVNNGQYIISDIAPANYDYPYYRKGGSPETYSGVEFRQYVVFTAPANLIGEEVLVWATSNPYNDPISSWELLNGQGRVRKAPELEYDTPSSFADGICGYDEYYGFYGALDRYDWKYLGKQEMYIPYNNNGMYALPPEPVHLKNYLDPAVTRWEKHRVWVVEATLHPGERNVLARRRMYVDEDTWTLAVTDAWDANGNLYKVGTTYNNVRPDVPGTLFTTNCVHNLQTGNYCTPAAMWDEKEHPTLVFADSYPDSMFDPTNMAAQAQY